MSLDLTKLDDIRKAISAIQEIATNCSKAEERGDPRTERVHAANALISLFSMLNQFKQLGMTVQLEAISHMNLAVMPDNTQLAETPEVIRVIFGVTGFTPTIHKDDKLLVDITLFICAGDNRIHHDATIECISPAFIIDYLKAHAFIHKLANHARVIFTPSDNQDEHGTVLDMSAINPGKFEEMMQRAMQDKPETKDAE